MKKLATGVGYWQFFNRYSPERAREKFMTDSAHALKDGQHKRRPSHDIDLDGSDGSSSSGGTRDDQVIME